jgi:hypothetical protein
MGAYLSSPPEPEAVLRVGVLADVQYADKDDKVSRYYRRSLGRLSAAVGAFNRVGCDLSCVIHLGDLIDGNSDDTATRADFDAVLHEFSALRAPVRHVIGNHCLELGREPLLAGLHTTAYYTAVLGAGWELIVIDTTDIGVRGPTAELVEEAHAFLAQHAAPPNAKTWNGGVSKAQLTWLTERLSDCRARRVRVVVAGHMPLWAPAASDMHVAFNHEEVAELLDAHADVVALYACGHYHLGGYARRPSGVHHWTCEGMVEMEAGAKGYAMLHICADRIDVVSADRGGGIKPRSFATEARRPPS